jgi:hypothetical protein
MNSGEMVVKMLRVSLSQLVLSRRFGTSLQNSKPFDFGEVSKRGPHVSEPLNIDALMNTRNVSDQLTTEKMKSGNPDNVKLANASGNRFAAMFQKERLGKQPGISNGNFNSKQKKQKPSNSYKQHSKPHRKIVRFEFKTGTDQGQAALKSIIAKVHGYDSSYKVRYVDPESNKIVSKHLVDICNCLDLKQNGLIMIPPKNDSEPCMVKQTTNVEMIRNYSEELAALKEKELLEKGSITALKALKQRQKLEKKKSAIKSLQMFWHISVGDLKNQKKSEIQSRLSKGESFNIYVKSKGGPAIEELDDDFKGDDITKSAKYRDEDALSLELKKREMIYNVLQEMLQDLPCQYEVKGTVETRLLIPVTPLDVCKTETETKKSEVKKTARAQKQKQDKKQQKVVKDECDLDALYLFKIED